MITPQQYCNWLALHAEHPASVLALGQLITSQEWESKKLVATTMQALGYTKSPKISKYLLWCGCTDSVVSSVLSTVKTGGDAWVTKSYVTQNPADIIDQGNSIHYSSCQATNSKSSNGANDADDVQIYEDIRKDVWLWVVGCPMRLGGDGWLARAKVRLLRDSKTKQPAGYFVDKIYGDVELLLADFEYLQQWAGDLPIYVQHNRFERYKLVTLPRPVTCESRHYGYQDSDLSHTMTVFKQVGLSHTLMYQAYTARNKVAGVYMTPLKTIKYNAQSCNMTEPSVDYKPWRGLVSSGYKTMCKIAFNVLGYPSRLDRSYLNTQTLKGTWLCKHITFRFKSNLDYVLYVESTPTLMYYRTTTIVVQDDPLLGFIKPINIGCVRNVLQPSDYLYIEYQHLDSRVLEAVLSLDRLDRLVLIDIFVVSLAANQWTSLPCDNFSLYELQNNGDAGFIYCENNQVYLTEFAKRSLYIIYHK